MFELIKNNRGLNTVDSLFNDFFSDSFFNTNSINTIDYYYSNDEKKLIISMFVFSAYFCLCLFNHAYL